MATKLRLNVVLDVSSFLGCVFKRGKLMLGYLGGVISVSSRLQSSPWMGHQCTLEGSYVYLGRS